MMFLYSSTVVLSWAFCRITISLSAVEDVELFESPFTALLFNLFVSTSLQLFKWLLLVILLLAIGELVVLLRLDLLLTICCFRLSSTLSSHWVPSPSFADDVVSGKYLVKTSLTFDTWTLGWACKEKKNVWEKLIAMSRNRKGTTRRMKWLTIKHNRKWEYWHILIHMLTILSTTVKNYSRWSAHLQRNWSD